MSQLVDIHIHTQILHTVMISWFFLRNTKKKRKYHLCGGQEDVIWYVAHAGGDDTQGHAREDVGVVPLTWEEAAPVGQCHLVKWAATGEDTPSLTEEPPVSTIIKQHHSSLSLNEARLCHPSMHTVMKKTKVPWGELRHSDAAIPGRLSLWRHKGVVACLKLWPQGRFPAITLQCAHCSCHATAPQALHACRVANGLSAETTFNLFYFYPLLQ